MDNLKQLVADNIEKLMAMSEDCNIQNALAKRSKVGQTTIGNYLRPDSYVGYPKLDKLQKIANCFGLETWQILHPTLGDKELSAREIQMYRRWKEEIKQLQNL